VEAVVVQAVLVVLAVVELELLSIP